MKTFFSYFMTSTDLKGSVRWETAPQLAAGSPSFPSVPRAQ